ncbi:alcohol dehydrogenase class IV [Bradyrhizobium diazoefficiens]
MPNGWPLAPPHPNHEIDRTMTNAFTPIEILRPTILEFGNGTITAAARFAERTGAKRPLVISDAFNARRIDMLALPGAVKVFGDVKPEPDLPNLEKAVAMAREAKPDLVVGFGGGSAMDLAKLVAVLCTSDVAFADIVGPEKVAGRSVALMQIPTTSGTGSEAGTRALVTDPVSQNKQAVQSRFMLADIAIVDPDLTMTVPKEVTAATGVDALAHCVEAYTSRKAHPTIDLYALEGARLVGRYLKRAVADGGDREARAGLALASLYGGYCLGPVNTTAGHAVAYPLGTRHHVAHRARLRGDLPAHAGLQHAGGRGEDARSAPGARTAGAGRCETRVRRDLRVLQGSRDRDAAVRARRAQGRPRGDGRRGARHSPPARQQPARSRPGCDPRDV